MACEIRCWVENDTESLAELLNNRKILDNLRDGLPFPYTQKDASEYINAMRNCDENSNFAFAIVCDKKVIGSIAVFRQDNIHFRTAELGYYIGEKYWNMGYATDAVKQICKYVFDSSDIIRIFAEPFARNTASCRVLEKPDFYAKGR